MPKIQLPAGLIKGSAMLETGQEEQAQAAAAKHQDIDMQDDGARSPPAATTAAADENDGWQEVTRQKKQALEPAVKFQQQAAATPQMVQLTDAVLIPVGPKFSQASVRLTPFPNSWSSTQIQQTSERYGQDFGYVVSSWSGLSNRGIPYGAVRFSKPASAKRMIASQTHGIPGAPKLLKFINWEGKVPADVFSNLPKAAGDAYCDAQREQPVWHLTIGWPSC